MGNVLKPFDLNGDGFIDMSDIIMVGQAYGSKRGDDNYEERLDFDQDGTIGALELNIMAAMFGVRIRDDEDDD